MSSTHSSSTRVRLGRWRSELLDLTRRNRLINFNPAVGASARSPHGVLLAAPGIDAIWNRLARLGKRQSFFDLESELALIEARQSLDFEDEEESEPNARPVRELKTDEVRAEPGGVRLGRMLSNLRSKARTSFEEQGVVTLFVAFGFLKWRDKAKKDGPEEEFYSPLLLVPVELVRSSTREPFSLRRQDEEVLLNPALLFKLENDFKIRLPDAPNIDDKGVFEWLGKVDALIGSRSGWSVVDSVFLSLFSFHKIAMFEDLTRNEAHFLEHPIVAALCGERGANLNSDIQIPEAHELDFLSPEEMQLVTEADSSQHRAVVAARRGASFVLQGPPGTGKSQTITNIIAECLEAGKKVLFVSEKMAALEVVHGRLKRAGLGDFCLEAHSSKANKRAVVAELSRTLKLGRFVAPDESQQSETLARLRRDLNSYASQLHQKQLPSRLSPFDAINSYTRFLDAPDVQFDFAGASSLDGDGRADIESWLSHLSRLDAVLRRAPVHPWRGVQFKNAGFDARSILFQRLDEAVSALATIEAGAPALFASLGLTLPEGAAPTLGETDRALALEAHIRALAYPELVARWLAQSASDAMAGRAFDATLRALAAQGRARSDELSAALSSWGARFWPHFLELDPADLRAGLGGGAWWEEHLGGRTALVGRRDEVRFLFEGDDALRVLLGRAQTHGQRLAQVLRVAEPSTLSEFSSLFELATLIAKAPRLNAAWFEPSALEQAGTQSVVARAAFESLSRTEAGLCATWRNDALDSLFDDARLSALLADESALGTASDSLRNSWAQLGSPRNQAQEEIQAVSFAVQLRELKTASDELSSVLEVEAPSAPLQSDEMARFARAVENCPTLRENWLDGDVEGLQSRLSEARRDYGEGERLETELAGAWHLDRLNTPKTRRAGDVLEACDSTQFGNAHDVSPTWNFFADTHGTQAEPISRRRVCHNARLVTRTHRGHGGRVGSPASRIGGAKRHAA